MCGIGGVLGASYRCDLAEITRQMVDALAHRHQASIPLRNGVVKRVLYGLLSSPVLLVS
jgi:hypothetical protein